MWSFAFVRAMMVAEIAAIPEENARAASPFSRIAIRSSSAFVVGFPRRV